MAGPRRFRGRALFATRFPQRPRSCRRFAAFQRNIYIGSARLFLRQTAGRDKFRLASCASNGRPPRLPAERCNFRARAEAPAERSRAGESKREQDGDNASGEAPGHGHRTWGARRPVASPRYMRSIIACPKAEVDTCFAPGMSRAKS